MGTISRGTGMRLISAVLSMMQLVPIVQAMVKKL